MANRFGRGVDVRRQRRWLVGEDAGRLTDICWLRCECWEIRGIGLGGALLDEIRIEIGRQIEIRVHHAACCGRLRRCFDWQLDRRECGRIGRRSEEIGVGQRKGSRRLCDERTNERMEEQAAAKSTHSFFGWCSLLALGFCLNRIDNSGLMGKTDSLEGVEMGAGGGVDRRAEADSARLFCGRVFATGKV